MSKNKNSETNTTKSVQFSRKQLLFLVQFAVLLALEALFCFTPLGSIPIGPVVATLAMIPVIVTSLALGAWAGTAMGFFAGLFSFIVNSFTFVTPTSFMFTPLVNVYGSEHGNPLSLIICFVPRILAGLFPALFFAAYKKATASRIEKMHKKATAESTRSDAEKRAAASRKTAVNSIIGYTISGLISSVTNTVGVLGLTWIIFGNYFATNPDLALGSFGAALPAAIGFTVLTNGIPEAIVAAVVTYAICKPILKFIQKKDLPAFTSDLF